MNTRARAARHVAALGGDVLSIRYHYGYRRGIVQLPEGAPAPDVGRCAGFFAALDPLVRSVVVYAGDAHAVTYRRDGESPWRRVSARPEEG